MATDPGLEGRPLLRTHLHDFVAGSIVDVRPVRLHQRIAVIWRISWRFWVHVRDRRLPYIRQPSGGIGEIIRDDRGVARFALSDHDRLTAARDALWRGQRVALLVLGNC